MNFKILILSLFFLCELNLVSIQFVIEDNNISLCDISSSNSSSDTSLALQNCQNAVQNFKCTYKYLSWFNCSWSKQDTFPPLYLTATSNINQDGFACNDEEKRYENYRCNFSELNHVPLNPKLIFKFEFCLYVNFKTIANFTFPLLEMTALKGPENFRFDEYANVLTWTNPNKIENFLKYDNSSWKNPDQIQSSQFTDKSVGLFVKNNQTNQQEIDGLNIEYEIEYKIQNVSYRELMTAKFEQTNLIFGNLISDEKHEFTIRCRLIYSPEKIKGQWSEKVELQLLLASMNDYKYWHSQTVTFYTLFKDLLTVPVSCEQALEITIQSDSTRDVTIYWKYDIFNLQKNRTFLIRLVSASETRINITQQSKYTFVHLENHLQYTAIISLYEENFFGIDIISYWTVPPIDPTITSNPIEAVHAFVTEDVYTIAWKLALNCSKYVIFWCEHDCQQGILWKQTNVQVYDDFYQLYCYDNLTLNVKRKNVLKFGVACAHKGLNFGIKWAKNYVHEISGERLTSLSEQWLLSQNIIREGKLNSTEIGDFTQISSDDIFKHYLTDWLLKISYHLQHSNRTHVIEFFELFNLAMHKKTAIELLEIPDIPKNVSLKYLPYSNSALLKWHFTKPVQWLDHYQIELLLDWTENSNYSKPLVPVESRCKSSECVHEFNHLEAYRTYNATIASCSKKQCSMPFSGLSFRTNPSSPGKIENFTWQVISTNTYRVYFTKPTITNGPIDFYHVLEIDENFNKEFHNYSSNETFKDITVKCPAIFRGKFEIFIFASNLSPNETKLEGVPSDAQRLDALCDNARLWFYGCGAVMLVCALIFGSFSYCSYRQFRKNTQTIKINVECNRDNQFETFDTAEEYEEHEEANLIRRSTGHSSETINSTDNYVQIHNRQNLDTLEASKQYQSEQLVKNNAVTFETIPESSCYLSVDKLLSKSKLTPKPSSSTPGEYISLQSINLNPDTPEHNSTNDQPKQQQSEIETELNFPNINSPYISVDNLLSGRSPTSALIENSPIATQSGQYVSLPSTINQTKLSD